MAHVEDTSGADAGDMRKHHSENNNNDTLDALSEATLDYDNFCESEGDSPLPPQPAQPETESEAWGAAHECALESHYSEDGGTLVHLLFPVLQVFLGRKCLCTLRDDIDESKWVKGTTLHLAVGLLHHMDELDPEAPRCHTSACDIVSHRILKGLTSHGIPRATCSKGAQCSESRIRGNIHATLLSQQTVPLAEQRLVDAVSKAHGQEGPHTLKWLLLTLVSHCQLWYGPARDRALALAMHMADPAGGCTHPGCYSGVHADLQRLFHQTTLQTESDRLIYDNMRRGSPAYVKELREFNDLDDRIRTAAKRVAEENAAARRADEPFDPFEWIAKRHRGGACTHDSE